MNILRFYLATLSLMCYIENTTMKNKLSTRVTVLNNYCRTALYKTDTYLGVLFEAEKQQFLLNFVSGFWKESFWLVLLPDETAATWLK